MIDPELCAALSALGYTFKNEDLLQTAFTHSSYVNEHKAESNERSEFLGDCALNFIVGEYLYETYPDYGEGLLSARRAATVSRAPLARLVDELGLLRYLRVGAGVNKSAFSDKTRSDLFEALVGAVYADGGMNACRMFLARNFFDKVKPERDYKTELQELAVKRGCNVVYKVNDSANGFTAVVSVGGDKFTGKGNTKHAAEIDAARHALAKA